MSKVEKYAMQFHILLYFLDIVFYNQNDTILATVECEIGREIGHKGPGEIRIEPDPFCGTGMVFPIQSKN